MLVTSYYGEHVASGTSEIFERSIGIGQVANIQENGLIRIRLLREVSGQSELWDRIRKRETAILSDVVIKPSIDTNAAGIEVEFYERG